MSKYLVFIVYLVILGAYFDVLENIFPRDSNSCIALKLEGVLEPEMKWYLLEHSSLFTRTHAVYKINSNGLVQVLLKDVQLIWRQTLFRS